MNPFDLLESPLTGTNLIEASAGTGKTYTLAGLFVRLIVEQQFTVNEILVVTYTEAATEELRDRIRRKLKEVKRALAAGHSDDAFCGGLLDKLTDRKTAARLIQEALHDFDQAPIFTIHAFCQRMLRENAFESAAPFDLTLMPDISEIEEEIVQDFWRRHFYDAPPELVRHAEGKGNGFSPKSLATLIRGRGTRSDIRIEPLAPPVALDSLDACRRAVAAVAERWPAVRDEVAILLEHPGLNKNTYRNPLRLIEEMDRWTRRRFVPFPEALDKFRASRLAKDWKKGCEPMAHAFFALCEDAAQAAERLNAQMDAQIAFLKGELFRYARTELPIRKARRRIQSFDDLLIRLREALDAADGAALATRIARKYRAALVDEFQDTDPVQYAIFRSVFEKGGALLFLIGDPKQAIYSFRGADLFAYIQAARHVGSRYTLSGNRRSEPALIDAVNAVFANRDKPFLLDGIAFEPAVPGAGAEPAQLAIDGQSEPPMHLWLLDSATTKTPGEVINKGIANGLIVVAVAHEIARLLALGRAGRAMIGGSPIREPDIAVLVRTNRQAGLMQKALGAARIPSVLFSMDNIFDTPEALDLERVLTAIAEPDREDLIRAALTTDFLGAGAAAIDAFLRNDLEWESVLARFRDYNDVWQKQGFIRMFRRLLAQEGVRERLLTHPDGERRLTNILQLAEILHQASPDGGRGLAGLVQWLARQRDEATPRLEAHQIRLERDVDAVRIVTMHKSKGLEYPIVFCPFCWDGSRIKPDQPFAFHDDHDNNELTLVIDPRHAGRDKAEEELLAENLRLLYVALTRARNRCYLVWGHLKDAGTSAPAYLFHDRSEQPDAGSFNLSALAQRFDTLTDATIRTELDPILERAKGAMTLSPLPDFSARPGGLDDRMATPAPDAPACRIFGGLRERDWQVASFSALIAGQEHPSPARSDSEAPDHDTMAAAAIIATEPAMGGIFDFPAGTRAGLFFHTLLEKLDFRQRDQAVVVRLVEETLSQYGFDSLWRSAVCDLLRDLIAVPLDPDDPNLSLAQIAGDQRLTELEFYFPLKRVTPTTLRDVFAKHETPVTSDFPEHLGRLAFQPVRGFMKGYIDLVFRHNGRFYLIDWKSNLLGSRRQDYDRESLHGSVLGSYYFLQYHLYTVALDSYLRQRLPGYDYDRHFGGVYYVFLRGINAADGPHAGIYRDKPKKALVAGLREALIEI